MAANLNKIDCQSDTIARACFDYLVGIVNDLSEIPAVGRFMLACPGSANTPMPSEDWADFVEEEGDGKRGHFWSMALVYRWLHFGDGANP